MAIYPHKESLTPNLCDDFKADLEKLALDKHKNEYEKQAIQFLLDTKTCLQIFNNGTKTGEHGTSYKYTIRIGKAYQRGESFELTDGFCGSINDYENKKNLTAYGVLAYFSMYAYDNRWFSPDDVYDEFGEMKPSQAKAIFDEQQNTRKILSFLYTENELEQLSEIK